MSLKKLAGETVIYGVSSILARVLSFLLVPIYTKLLAPDEYGIVAQLFAVIFFAIVFFTYRMELAYFRFGTDKNEDRAGNIQRLAFLSDYFNCDFGKLGNTVCSSNSRFFKNSGQNEPYILECCDCGFGYHE